MSLLIVIIMVIGLAGIIGNQYAMLRRMEHMEQTLRDIKDHLQK